MKKKIKYYDITSAINLLKKDKLANFKKNKESIDLTLIFNMGNNNKSKYKKFSGSIILPHINGKKNKISVLYNKKNSNDLKNNNFNIVNNKDIIKQAQEKKINMDILMSIKDEKQNVEKISKILNKFKIMPKKLSKNIEEINSFIHKTINKKVNFKICNNGIMHIPLSRVNFKNKLIIENIRAFINIIKQKKPDKLKGVYIKKICLSRTMGRNFNLLQTAI